jgi:hypothetical protein
MGWRLVFSFCFIHFTDDTNLGNRQNTLCRVCMRSGLLCAALIHTCGQRLARLMLKLLTATFLLSFEHETTDEAGRPAAPVPNWNEELAGKPDEKCFLRYTRRSGVEL